MLELSIQKDSPVPIYYQVKQQLHDLIRSGRLKEGDLLPGEAEWARHLGISRMTLRNALLQLVQEGLLVREKGRGTFVSHPRVSIPVTFETGMFGFSDLFSADAAVSRRVVRQECLRPAAYVREKLNLNGSAMAVYLEIVRLVDDQPVALEYGHYPAELLGWLLDINLEERSVYSLLKERGLEPWETEDEIAVDLTSEEQAASLMVTSVMPVVYGRRLAWDRSHRAIELYQLVLRGDYFRMVARSSR